MLEDSKQLGRIGHRALFQLKLNFEDPNEIVRLVEKFVSVQSLPTFKPVKNLSFLTAAAPIRHL